MKFNFYLLWIALAFCACKKSGPKPAAADDAQNERQQRALSLDSLKPLASNIPKANYADLTFINSSTGFAIAAGLIVKTTDGGLTWTSYPLAGDPLLKKIQFTDSQTGYVIGGSLNSGLIFKTSNAGQTWTKLSFDHGTPVAGMHFISNTTGFIAGSGLFSKTTDGGLTWTSIKDNSTAGYNDVVFKDAQEGIVTATKGSYFKTTDGGVSWQKQQLNTGNNLGYVYFTSSASLISKSADTLVDVERNQAVTRISPFIYKLHYLNEAQCIGIGSHFEDAYWPYGDVLISNDNWTNSARKTYSQNDAISFTAIGNMTDQKTMILGMGFGGTKVLVLSR